MASQVGASAVPSKPNVALFLVTATVMVGMIMAIIDASIVNVALNTMAGNLGASIDEIGWVATGYILSNVVIMPLNGYLTALLGRKRFYATCVAIFTVASFLCGTASNVWLLVFYRVIQGLGGGALIPTAQAILFESFPPERRGQSMAYFGLAAMVGPAIGPTLGGYLVQNYTWPLIFFINIPLGILGFFMTLAFIEDPDYLKRPKQNPDWPALVAMTVGISSLQYVLERGEHDDWFNSGLIVTLTATAVIGVAMFIYRELRDRHPFVDLHVFRSRAFSIGNIVGLISGFGLFGLTLILPLFLQIVLNFDAWQTGLALLPGAIATALSMPIAGNMVGRVDARLSIAFGLFGSGVAAWWLGSFSQNAGYWDIFWPRALQGFTLGFLFVPLSTVMLAGIERSKLANATGLGTLIRQLGGSLGIAILTTLLVWKQKHAFNSLTANVSQAHYAVRQFLDQATSHQAALMQIAAMLQRDAALISYNFLFRLSAIVFFCSVPLVLLLPKVTARGSLQAPAE
ncbi:MAG TPA: DHA2 family efflux MFS transporter permease subunit [Candidatus Eremiobacteraceae bacterium]|nr:DHA2 family efflux MFS transporter permease subunit [Candidatus Eremiobacteraceae bacterium]